MSTLPPPLFELDPAETVERQRSPRRRAESTLPPPLFEQRRGPLAITYTPFTDAFVPHKNQLCGGCRKPMGRLLWTGGCGGAQQGGHFVLCDHCAAHDFTADGLPKWGLTETFLAMERARHRVYLAGGGETEVVAEFERSGLAAAWRAEQAEFEAIRQRREGAA